MCTVTNLDEERKKILMHLLSDMTRANDMMDEFVEEQIDIRLGLKKEMIGYLPVGLGKSNQSQPESIDMFFSFVAEKNDKIISQLQRMKQTFRSGLFHKNKQKASVQMSNSEIREDYTVKTFEGHTEGVLAVALDRNFLVSGSCDGTIKVWNHLSASCNITLTGHTGWVNLLEFLDSDGKLVSGSYDQTIKLWDLHKGIKIHTLRGHKGSISCMKIKDRAIITGSYDNQLNLWDPRHYKKSMMTFTGHTAPVLCFELKGNNELVTGSRDTTLRVWDIRTGKTLRTLTGHNDWVKCCKIEGDLVLSGSCDSSIKIWNLTNNDPCRTLSGHSGTINHIHIDSARKRVYSSSADSSIKVWNLQEGTLQQTLQSHTDEVLVCLPFNKLIASCSFDSSVKIWSPENGTLLCNLIGHNLRMSSMISFENKILTASWDKTVKLWEFPMDFKG